MTKEPDLTYTADSMFTRFIPQTPEGENAWRQMAEQDGSGVAAVLNFEAKRVIAQLRAAGYTVRKAQKCKQSVDEILAELTA